MILARKYVETGFSLDDAAQLVKIIEDTLAVCQEDEIIEIDFSGVKFFTTQFFNNSIGKYVLQMGPDKFAAKFKIINLSKAGLSTFQHSYDNAVSYFNLPPQERIVHDDIVNESEEF